MHVQLFHHGSWCAPCFSQTTKFLIPQATTLNAEFLFRELIIINLVLSILYSFHHYPTPLNILSCMFSLISDYIN